MHPIDKKTEWVQPLTRPIKMNDTALNWMPACMNHAKRLAISTFPRPIASYWNYHKCLLIYCDDCAVLLRCLPIYRFFNYVNWPTALNSDWPWAHRTRNALIGHDWTALCMFAYICTRNRLVLYSTDEDRKIETFAIIKLFSCSKTAIWLCL